MTFRIRQFPEGGYAALFFACTGLRKKLAGRAGFLHIKSVNSGKLILLAKIGAARGIKGEVRVQPFGEAAMLDQYGALETGSGRKLRITRMQPAGNMLVVKFEGVNSRNDAEALNGEELFVDRAKLPPPDKDEFYVSDLIGMSVVDGEGNVLGSVRDVPNFGAGDLLEVQPGNGGRSGSYYLPFTLEVVREIDFATGRLTVVPPPETTADPEDGK